MPFRTIPTWPWLTTTTLEPMARLIVRVGRGLRLLPRAIVRGLQLRWHSRQLYKDARSATKDAAKRRFEDEGR